MEQVQTFGELLKYLAGPGALVIVTVAVSWGLEGWVEWQRLDGKVKSALMLFFAVAIGVGGVAAQSLPAETIATIEPYAQVILLIVGAWVSTQVAHGLNPTRAKNKNLIQRLGLLQVYPDRPVAEQMPSRKVPGIKWNPTPEPLNHKLPEADRESTEMRE